MTGNIFETQEAQGEIMAAVKILTYAAQHSEDGRLEIQYNYKRKPMRIIVEKVEENED